MPTRVEYYPSVADVDFEAWHVGAGVVALVLDMEGTLTEYGGSEVDTGAVLALQEARERGFIDSIGIFTHTKDRDIVAVVAKRIEADAFETPRSRDERKPNPVMIHRLLEKFKVTPEQAGVVGDKRSADVKAGIRAGVARIAWVDRYGRRDHIGDRLIRRPYEAPFKAILKRTGVRRYE